MPQNAPVIHVHAATLQPPLATSAAPCAALVLSGGGARSAYQVGVLKALSRLLPREEVAELAASR